VLDLDAATDATVIAAELTGVERTIRSDGASPEEAAAAGRRQQLLYRYLSGRPEIDAEVIAGVADDVRPSVQRTIQVRQAVQALRSGTQRPPLPTTLPAWRIREPLPPDKLLAYYRDAESLTGVPWYWLAAINLQETRMGRIDGVSSAGAVGPMQFLPSTWAGCCTGDPLDPREAIIGAATYLVDRGAPADTSAALYGYNPSDAYVVLVTAYAENLRDDERAYRGYHAWQVFFESAAGDVRLAVGYTAAEEIDAATYLADHPEDAAG
jgi:membrane-bound lytic murein transglycosylase B